MDNKFRELIDGLDEMYQALISMAPVIAEDIPNDTPVGGVYLFSEGSLHLYAGRTKRKIAVRIRNHFSTAPDCLFAGLLARDVARKRASYKSKG